MRVDEGPAGLRSYLLYKAQISVCVYVCSASPPASLLAHSKSTYLRVGWGQEMVMG